MVLMRNGVIPVGLLLMTSNVNADELSAGDTAWMLTATALVLFMTIPGLSLFYAGMVRSKNVLSVLMQCFAITGLISILWVVYGYSVAFGGEGAFWGGLDKLFLTGVNVESLSGTIPETVFMTFQMTFAIITPALIVGAFAEQIAVEVHQRVADCHFRLHHRRDDHRADGTDKRRQVAAQR